MKAKQQILPTGLGDCYDEQGRRRACENTGEDAEFSMGIALPEPRFAVDGDLVRDLLTNVIWPKSFSPFTFPFTWKEARSHIARANSEHYAGRNDWRLPERRELRSLVCHGAKSPSLPHGHPFSDVFQGRYWTKTPYAADVEYAWWLEFSGGRMFFGRKSDALMVVPVAGEYIVKNDATARRFILHGDVVLDERTGLRWSVSADALGMAVTWQAALDAAAKKRREAGGDWRLPNINELESLVDVKAAKPALAAGHPFLDVRDVYWSSTTSSYETDWAYCLYLDKGAVGVGYKTKPEMYVWLVCGP